MDDLEASMLGSPALHSIHSVQPGSFAGSWGRSFAHGSTFHFWPVSSLSYILNGADPWGPPTQFQLGPTPKREKARDLGFQILPSTYFDRWLRWSVPNPWDTSMHQCTINMHLNMTYLPGTF